MREWSGGKLHSNETIALTGTSRRQKVLPRVRHNNEDEKESEPFASNCHHTAVEVHEISQREKRNLIYVVDSAAETQTSKCVYSYEDRYMFNRIISGTDLLFDSHFESGNLSQAFRRGGCDREVSNYIEYDLTLDHDVHSIGHTQWFYFSVSNMVANTTVKFNIGKFTKPTSLFNGGMMPLLYSEKRGKWCRCGEDISYCRSKRTRTKKNVYILTFTHTFEHSKDKCYFAYSYPYTYSDLQDYLKSLQLDDVRSKCFRRSLLSLTLGGNRCDLLTITEPTSSLKELQKRKGILISARVHPGETVASWICRGFIDFLTSNHEHAIALRRTFVFKVIPMLNPDGVINGNYRTSLSGVDLNRRWNDPHKVHHPTIFQTKALMKRFQATRDVIISCDIHGHSRREGLFMYGCPRGNWNKSQLTSHTVPTLFDNQCEFFNLHRCTFRVQGCKASTMRAVMYKEFGIESSYTLESSLSGYKGYHFSIRDLLTMGKDLCNALYDLHLILAQQQQTRNSEYCCIDTQIFNFPNEISTVTTPSHHHNVKRTNTRRNSKHDFDDSGGSDSNPSEDNMSESEALQLLRSKTSNVPLKRKKKKKKSRKIKSATIKEPRTTSISKRALVPKRTKICDCYDDVKEPPPETRVLRSCSIIQLGATSTSEPAKSVRRLSNNDSFKGKMKTREHSSEKMHQKQGLKSLVFPLGRP